MGGKLTKETTPTPVYKFNEHTVIQKIINSILTEDHSSFKDNNYVFGQDDSCSNFSIVLESELKKHLRVELLDMKDKVLLIPRVDGAKSKDKYITKDELCKDIASHYNRILTVLQVVHKIYHIEQHGRNSIAGICLRNVNNSPSILQIHYCASMQRYRSTETQPSSNSYDAADIYKIDFNKHMDGMKLFVTQFMNTQRERNIFIRTLKNILLRKDKTALTELLSCGDDLIDAKTMRQRVLNGANSKCNTDLQTAASSAADTEIHDTCMQIVEMNPIFDPDMCPSSDRNQFVVDKGAISNAELTKLNKLYKKMIDDYKKCLLEVQSVINKIIVSSNNIILQKSSYVLNDLSTDDLNEIEKEAKKNIAIFFYTSLFNYQALLDFVKTLNHVNTSGTISTTRLFDPKPNTNGGSINKIRKANKHTSIHRFTK